MGDVRNRKHTRVAARGICGKYNSFTLTEPSQEPDELATIPIPVLQRTLKLRGYITLPKSS